MKKLALLALSALCLSAYAKPAISQQQALEIFKVAGYTGKFNTNDLTYRRCKMVDGESHCTVAHIEFYKDINGDGSKEVLIIDDAETSYTYGNIGQAFTLLTKERSGFREIASDIANPVFLKTKGKNNYPDLELGMPGFCFPVLRYNGKTYEYHRSEGETCN